MEGDRLVRRLGFGNAGEVFEAVLEGKVYALKLFTRPEKCSAEERAYKKLLGAVEKAKKEAKSKNKTELITLNSFCHFHGHYPVESLLNENSARSLEQQCILSHPIAKYYSIGLQLELIDGPTLDDDENGGTGAVTTVLKTEGQRRRVWERLRDALEWLHREAKMVHGSVNGRNIILVRVAERMRKMEDERKEEEEEEQEDYMPVLIDFNHADMRENLYTEEGWRHDCISELDKADRLLPMVALKDMVASQGKTTKSDDYCKKAQALFCGTCFTCLRRRLDRLKTTVRALLGYDVWKYAGGNEEIVQPMFADALHVVTGILQDIEQNKEPGNGIGGLKSLVEQLAKELLWTIWDELPCAGAVVFRTVCGI